jgi:aryl-alcohol dehydrogenase-like predicted oxidoreductase
LSEVGVETIRRAHAVHPIVDLQIEYALVSRNPEATIFPALRELGIAATVYGVLSRGLLSGSKPTSVGDYRAHLPRFTGENGIRNQRLVDELRRIADEKAVTTTQLAIAWVMAKGSFLFPTIGARTRKQLDESLAALSIELTEQEVRRLETAVPAEEVAGSRYQEAQMKGLDSER